MGESSQGVPSLAGLAVLVRRKVGVRSFSRGLRERVTEMRDLASSASMLSSNVGVSGRVGA